MPPTSMAAHAVDEDVEIELDTMQITANGSRRVDEGPTHDIKRFPLALPPLPPVITNYSLVSMALFLADSQLLIFIIWLCFV